LERSGEDREREKNTGWKRGRASEAPKRNGVKLLASPSEGVSAKGDLGIFTRSWGISHNYICASTPCA